MTTQQPLLFKQLKYNIKQELGKICAFKTESLLSDVKVVIVHLSQMF